jgi:hypothetical protein
MKKVAFLGGPFDGRHAELEDFPEHVLIGGVRYDRVDNPGTGDFLGGYVWAYPREQPEVVSDRNRILARLLR